MDVFGWVKGIFGDKGLVGSVTDVVEKYWPPDTSPTQKAEFQFAMTKEMNAKEAVVLENAHKMDAEFNQRIKDMEGTAADLKTIPYIGALLIFLRGAQRPIWGFATLYLDYMVFAGMWKTEPGSHEASAFMAINILVLGFLFGERAIQNIMPYLIQYAGAKGVSLNK